MRSRTFALGFTILLVFSFKSTSAQEIGVSAGKLWNSNARLGNPAEFGIYIQHKAPISFRLEYGFSFQRIEEFGTLSSGCFPPPQTIVYENIEISKVFHSLEISMQFPYLYSYAGYNLGAGLGFSLLNVSSTVSGKTSGETFEPLGTTMLGVFYSVRIEKENALGLPVNVGLMFKQKFLAGPDQVVTDVSRFLEPLSDDNYMKSLQLYAAFHF